MLSEQILLDTCAISFWADNKKVYSTSLSDDKKRLLLYRKNSKNDVLTITAKVYDDNFNQLDSIRNILAFEQKKNFYSDLKEIVDQRFFERNILIQSIEYFMMPILLK
jgi:hypothetical protein